MAIGIYKITNKENGKVYIGQSKNTNSRWYQHKQAINKIDKPLYNDMGSLGISAFTFEVIEHCSEEQLNDREKYWIKKYNATNKELGYNIDKGGQYNSHLTHLEVQGIIQHLREFKLNHAEIAMLYNTSKTAITNINLGKTYVQPNIKYPIRTEVVNRTIPTKEELSKSLYEKGFPATYRYYKTTLGPLKRWCNMLGIPDNKQQFIPWYEENYSK